MVETLKPDLCVIGAGVAGLTAAAAAAALGTSVVLVEQGKMGGDRLNYGDVPSKALIAAARRASQIATAPAFGVTADRVTVDFRKVRDHIREVVATVAPNAARERAIGLGIRVVAGLGNFTDRTTLAVGDDILIEARHFIIATGSLPAVPAIPGLKDVPFLTNETIFDLDVCPAHLIVIGAGATGIEMAQAFRRLGAAVTVLEAARPLAQGDPECVEIVLDQLAREGVDIRSGADVLRVKGEPSKIEVVIGAPDGTETIEGSHLLVATGRSPNVGGLDLAAGRIKHDASGIGVDEHLRTSNRRVYAIGDVAGGRFSHVAAEQANRVVKSALSGRSAKPSNDTAPWVIFTDPELAQVGLTETAAKKRGRAFQVLRWPYFDNDRAQAERQTRGHIKVITMSNGQIVGATIVGAQAGEIIAAWALAVQHRLNIQAFAELILPSPTLAEIGQKAANSRFKAGLTGPLLGRIINRLRRHG